MVLPASRDDSGMDSDYVNIPSAKIHGTLVMYKKNGSGDQKHQRSSSLHGKEPTDWLGREINKQRITLKYNKGYDRARHGFRGHRQGRTAHRTGSKKRCLEVRDS